MNYIDDLLIVISTITRYVFISPYAYLGHIPMEIKSCAIGLKIWIVTAEIKIYNSITMKKKKRKHIK